MASSPAKTFWIVLTFERRDKGFNALLVEVIKGVEVLPGGERDAVLHLGVWHQDNEHPIVNPRLDGVSQITHEPIAACVVQGLDAGSAVVPDNHAAVFHIVDERLFGKRLVVDTPVHRRAMWT